MLSFFPPLSESQNGLCLIEFSNSHADFSFFYKLSLDYAAVLKNANSLKRALTYNRLQLRCGVNLITGQEHGWGQAAHSTEAKTSGQGTRSRVLTGVLMIFSCNLL